MNMIDVNVVPQTVAPVRERGLKFEGRRNRHRLKGCRSREGAWIEIASEASSATTYTVAPVRERGLKFERCEVETILLRRSREGAWIEIQSGAPSIGQERSLP